MKKFKMLSVLLCFVLVISTLTFGASANEKELTDVGGSVYYINSYEQLKNLANAAQADCRYILSEDIIQDDNLNNLEIIIPAGAVFNLDLNGYNIQRSTKGNDCALFRIKSDGRMTIKDTADVKTGYCSFSEGYSDYNKAVFFNDGGELEIYNGYYEIFSPYEQGSCSVIRTTSGYTNIYDGIFDSSSAWGGDTISVGHDAYLYDTPHVNIFGGDFYGKYQSIDVSPLDNYLNYGKEYPNGALYPTIYVIGGNFFICNGGKNGEQANFAYCNNGWGRVIVAEGTVLAKCLNSSDQRFLSGASKKLTSQTIDSYTGGYYEVTAPPVIMADGLDYYYRLVGMCDKAVVNSYDESVHKIFKEQFDAVKERIDTILVTETQKGSPLITLENRTQDHKYINWYMVEESSYNGEETDWTHLGDVQNVSQWTPDERPEEGGNYIIRCVVTKSDLTTYEDIVRIAYAPLKKAETVDSVEIDGVATPVAGDTLDFDFVPANDSFYINGVFWTDITDPKNKVTLKETDVFEAGHEYQLEVWIRAHEYYQFKLDSDECIDITALVGGKEAEVILPGTAISAELALTYTVSSEPTKPSDSTDPTEPSASTEPTKTTESSVSTEPSTNTDTKPSESVNLTEPSTDSKTEPSESSTVSTDKPTEPSDSTSTTPSVPDTDNGILGDVNGDGKVNIKDVTEIQKYAAKLIDLTDAEKLRADVNTDVKINIKDATAIQKYVAKIETGLPIGEIIK